MNVEIWLGRAESGEENLGQRGCACVHAVFPHAGQRVTLPGVFVVHQGSGGLTRAQRKGSGPEWRVDLALRVRPPFAVTDIPAVGAIADGLIGINDLSVLITRADMDGKEALDLSERIKAQFQDGEDPRLGPLADGMESGVTIRRFVEVAGLHHPLTLDLRASGGSEEAPDKDEGPQARSTGPPVRSSCGGLASSTGGRLQRSASTSMRRSASRRCASPFRTSASRSRCRRSTIPRAGFRTLQGSALERFPIRLHIRHF